MAARLPWFLSTWSNQRDHLDTGRQPPSEDALPDRFALGSTLPAVYLVCSVYSFIYYDSIIAELYEFVWVVFPIGSLYVLYIQAGRHWPPEQDNRTIGYTVAVQFIVFFFILLLPAGLIGVATSSQPLRRISPFGMSELLKSSIILGIGFIYICTYYAPEVLVRLKYPSQRYKPLSTDDIIARGYKRTRSVLMLFVLVIFLFVYGVQNAFTDLKIGITSTFMISSIVVYLIILWQSDKKYFRPDYELSEREELGIALGFMTWLLGFTMSIRFEFELSGFLLYLLLGIIASGYITISFSYLFSNRIEM